MQSLLQLREYAEIAKARTDLAYFSQHCWRDTPENRPNGQFQQDWYHILQGKNTLGKLFTETKRLHIQAPREHAKTTCLSVKYPLWLLGNDPNLRILIVSKTSTLATDILRECRQNIEQNEKLQQVFPELQKDEPWADSGFLVQRTRIDKTITMRGVGLHGSITGGRADIIILDDPFDVADVSTELQRKKVEEYIEKVVIPVLTPDGTLIAIGTRWHQADYWNKLMQKSVEKGGPYVVKIYRAINEDKNKKPYALWPEVWPLERLLQRKNEIGTVRFACLYQNDPSGYEGRLFKGGWLKNGYYNPEVIGHHPRLQIMMAVDPSASDNPEANFTAIATIGYDPEYRDIFLLDMYADRIDFPSQVKKIVELGRRSTIPFLVGEHRVHRIGVESNVYQKALAKTAYMQGLPVIEIKTRASKVERMLGLQPHFENGRIKLPNPELVKPGWFDDWLEEYLTFPSGSSDDRMDALEMAVSLCDLSAEAGSFSFGPRVRF